MHLIGKPGAFWRSCGGTIAPLFATSILVVVGAVGLSIDGARIYGAKQKLQTICDSAVLAAARRAIADGSTDQVVEAFQSFLAVSGIDQELSLRPSTPDTSMPKRLSAELIADMPTVIMPVLGFSTVEIRAHATAEFGFTKLEIALALDNTGSMAGAKLEALKTSANRLVDLLLDKAPEDGDIRISLVPFAQYANVGLEHRNASWIDVRSDYSETVESCGDVAPLLSSTNCRTVTYTYYQDGKPMTGSYQQCDNVYGPPVYQCTSYTNTYTWSGCVGSRAYPLNLRDDTYATRIPGLLNTACPSKIQPLTSSRATLHNSIDAMVATGETYVPSGLMWGWRTLSTLEPYTESEGDRVDANGNKISKVLILMTDGENTKSPTYPAHDGSDAALANTLTRELCREVKLAGISVYTVAFDVSDATISSLLGDCSSGPPFAYSANTITELQTAFESIGRQITAVRLSK